MVKLRKIQEKDLVEYSYWQLPEHQYQDFNGPYFKKKSKSEIDVEIRALQEKLSAGNDDPLPEKRLITNEEDKLLGEVNWYWKSKETNWLEIGIVIYDDTKWGKGIGCASLLKWIDEIFATRKEIVRLGLTTWSGNRGMIKLAERLGMKKEAQYRNARIVKGKYYDSISYGVLREEWNQMKQKTGILK